MDNPFTIHCYLFETNKQKNITLQNYFYYYDYYYYK